MTNSKCNICNANLEYELKEELTNDEVLGFRETLFCNKCSSISRDRAFMWAFSNCIENKF